MSVYQFEVTEVSGRKVPLSRYEGKVLLIVNTACKCRFTPQLESSQTLRTHR